MNADQRMLRWTQAALQWVKARPKPRWRYLAVAVGFSALAVLRWAQGSTWWGLLFLAVAVANVWLAWFAPSPGTGAAAPERATVDSSSSARAVDPELVARSIDFHRRRVRTWTTLAVACLLVGAVVVPAVPAFGAAAGLTALIALGPAARSRRSTRSLLAVASAAADSRRHRTT